MLLHSERIRVEGKRREGAPGGLDHGRGAKIRRKRNPPRTVRRPERPAPAVRHQVRDGISSGKHRGNRPRSRNAPRGTDRKGTDMADNVDRIVNLGLNRLHLLSALFPVPDNPAVRRARPANRTSRAEIAWLFADELGYR